MATLKELAATGKTVASTIHQPASEIFETFDNLMLLHQGTVAYFGKADASLDHFGALGVRVGRTTTPPLSGEHADAPAPRRRRPPRLCRRVGRRQPAGAAEGGGVRRRRRTCGSRAARRRGVALLELVKRNVRNYKRNPRG